MGDRTNITDARQHDAEQAAGVIERAMRNEGLIDKDVRLMGEIIAEALDAAGFDVVLRADPDTSDEHKPCPHCNDEGVVCTLDGEIIGPCDCTSDDLFTEARRLLDAYPEDVFESPPQDWKAGMVTGTVPDAVDEDGYLDVWITPDAFAAHVLRKIALPVIAALLAERDADVSAGAVARTVAMSHIAAERDAERVARERAEAEARQLREAIREHKDRHNSWRQQTQRPSDIALWAALNAAAVAEGAEDRGQTDG